MAYSGSSAPQRISVAPKGADASVISGPSVPINGNSASEVDYSAHPFLDPALFRRDREALRYFRRLFRDSMRADGHYARLLNQLLHPIGEDSDLGRDERTLASFLQDESTYIRELLGMLPAEYAQPLEPTSEVSSCTDLRSLGELVFYKDRGDIEHERRVRFEAQRKLYLTKLLIQIEHTRMIQDGPRHRAYLIDLLERELFGHVTDVRNEIASYAPDPEVDLMGGPAGAPPEETWGFRVHRVERQVSGSRREIEVWHFDTRFKRESAGYEYSPGRGEYRVSERVRFGEMQRGHSASILSKMLRKGINNPNRISDMLGAKFIVKGERDVSRLAHLLHELLGGIFLFRNQVDLFRRPGDRGLMNRFSAPDFRAFKEDVDVLYRPIGTDHGRPYLFSVELQILTVESFLQSVHSRAYTSHREYKRRQFLQGVMPLVFPAAIYTPARSFEV
ncbi:hypothetical protein DRQ53_01600 [bacterium]|nr:MAG: hypothetical protein DRQ32_00235 [bacterium]RKZ18106.1 MAG: hypothetical protein DRQ53_01600 [bacterium]